VYSPAIAISNSLPGITSKLTSGIGASVGAAAGASVAAPPQAASNIDAIITIAMIDQNFRFVFMFLLSFQIKLVIDKCRYFLL
jgi:hypothetical protein